jgi:hypothetical protein
LCDYLISTTAVYGVGNNKSSEIIVTLAAVELYCVFVLFGTTRYGFQVSLGECLCVVVWSRVVWLWWCVAWCGVVV